MLFEYIFKDIDQSNVFSDNGKNEAPKMHRREREKE